MGVRGKAKPLPHLLWNWLEQAAAGNVVRHGDSWSRSAYFTIRPVGRRPNAATMCALRGRHLIDQESTPDPLIFLIVPTDAGRAMLEKS